MKDMFLSLLNAYPKEKFHNELDRYIELVNRNKSDDLSKLFTDIQTSVFGAIRGRLPQSNPFVISFPYLIKNHNVDYIYTILVEIKRTKFDLKENLQSFLCDITAYNYLYRSDVASKLLSAVDMANGECDIENFYSNPQRLGLGSFMLHVLESIMSLYSVKKITGWLSPVDLENRDIQENFYKKNGFSISYSDENRENGWIVKKLDNPR
jgi:hypothetical protein